ncbi:MAG: TM1266 family iron-only hydrogenase system putative regulator [Candidatus Omnitrophota bacterium]
MEKRLGFVGIILEDRKKQAQAVNQILSEYGDNIVARVGLPYKERNCSVITLTVDITTDDLGTMTGKLGNIEGVSVKSALSKQNAKNK